MPADPARRALTTEELEAAFQAVPPDQVAEILDGELFVQPRPAPRHASAAGELYAALSGPFRHGRDGAPGGWVLLPEPELHLGPRPDKVVPDLAGWRRMRMPAVPDSAAIALAPDWACEVVSPGTEHNDRTRKRRIYRREGVGHYWLIDPTEQSLEVYRLVDGRWLEVETFEGQVRVRAEPFDAIELDLGLLWSR